MKPCAILLNRMSKLLKCVFYSFPHAPKTPQGRLKTQCESFSSSTCEEKYGEKNSLNFGLGS